MGITDNKDKMAGLFSFNEVLINISFIRIRNDEKLKFSIGVPFSVLKAVDNATLVGGN
ncbi:MAG: hypothetical protein HQK51_20225 [Oligoflexia bacterium]|nr:hypothetical protein [Oligoflexia bacterium]